MKLATVEANGKRIAIVQSDDILIHDVQSALDLVGTLWYETECDRIVLHKSSISESFFDLKTKLAGDVLQKFINYRVKVAIVGDFSGYASSSLKDFIYECNNGSDIFFLESEQQATERLAALAR